MVKMHGLAFGDRMPVGEALSSVLSHNHFFLNVCELTFKRDSHNGLPNSMSAMPLFTHWLDSVELETHLMIWPQYTTATDSSQSQRALFSDWPEAKFKGE